MVIAYEAGIIMLHGSTPEYARPALAAKQILQWFFSLFGATGFYLPGLALLVVLFVIHIASHQPWKVMPQPLLGWRARAFCLPYPC